MVVLKGSRGFKARLQLHSSLHTTTLYYVVLLKSFIDSTYIVLHTYARMHEDNKLKILEHTYIPHTVTYVRTTYFRGLDFH